MKKLLFLSVVLASLFLADTPAFAPPPSNPMLQVEEIDGAPSGPAYKLKVSNGYLSSSSGGVITLALDGSSTTSTSPGITMEDSSAEAGTAFMYGNSSGGEYDVVMSIGVEDSAGESQEYIQLDGVNETIDLARPVWSTSAISGAKNIVTTTDGTESPTAAQMYGTIFVADHATATSDTDYTLPGAAAGMYGCFYDNGGGTGGIIIDAASGDEFLLYGAGITAGDAIDSPGVAGDGANGDYICIVAIDATYWITQDGSGTWVDGGAN